MLHRLRQTVDELSGLHTKLILLIGPPGSGKSSVLAKLGSERQLAVLNVGLELSRRLSQVARDQRPLAASRILRQLADDRSFQDLLLIDNVEVLFDASLKADPLGLLKQLARNVRVVAAWPGELREGRLIYAEMGHPEHQEFDVAGVIPIQIEKTN